jgi:hypothetical protein
MHTFIMIFLHAKCITLLLFHPGLGPALAELKSTRVKQNKIFSLSKLKQIKNIGYCNAELYKCPSNEYPNFTGMLSNMSRCAD